MLDQNQLQTVTHTEVEQVVREHLAAFGRGDFDMWGESLAPNVFFTAADPEGVFWDRETAVAEMHKDFDPAFDEDLQIEVEPQSFHVGYTSDGKAAWSASPLSYAIRFQGETGSFVLRHSSLLSRSVHGWFILVSHYSLVLPEATLLQARIRGRLPDPSPVGAAVGQGAYGLVEEFKSQIGDLSRAAIHPNAQVFGPLPGEHAEGEMAVRALFATLTARWGGLRLRPDGIRANIVSKQSGWVMANVEVAVPYAGEQVSLPLRALMVYHKKQDQWTIAHAHLSVGIPDELAE